MADPDMLFDLTFKDADIHEALDDFFRVAERPFMFDDEVKGVISVHVADVGFDDALQLILPKDYEALEVGGIYHIHRVRRPTEQQEF